MKYITKQTMAVTLKQIMLYQ